MILVLIKKFLGKRQSHRLSDPDTPEQKVKRIQEGDTRLRNQFITDYQPYVAKMASRFSKRYIEPDRDDEFSIALGAFNEAINQYSPESGRSFLSFAETVVRRRLIDHIRKERRFSEQIPYSSFEIEDDEENVVNPVEIHQAIEQYEKQKTIEERRSEIADFSRSLQEFGITFTDLVDCSPKHADSREMLYKIAATLAGDEKLMQIVLTKKTLPIKELLNLVGVSRKTLERNRKYLIALALIHNGPYPYLKDYLRIPEQPCAGEE